MQHQRAVFRTTAVVLRIDVSRKSAQREGPVRPVRRWLEFDDGYAELPGDLAGACIGIRGQDNGLCLEVVQVKPELLAWIGRIQGGTGGV
jgi:hypothetical protein